MRHAPIALAMAPLILTLAACGSGADNAAGDAPATADGAPAAAFPASLSAFGDGYPNAGDPCRRLGESDATREWLDDSADLVGCPTTDAAAALNGRTLATVEGITVVSVPSAGAGMAQGAETGDGPGSATDAMVAGTNFNATTILRCSMTGGAATEQCNAGVRRRAGPDGESYVEITRPNGLPRVIVFQGTRAFSADGAEADGSSAYTFRARREGDDTLIEFGPERYVIPDAVITGG